jgi:hypothetical protein
VGLLECLKEKWHIQIYIFKKSPMLLLRMERGTFVCLLFVFVVELCETLKLLHNPRQVKWWLGLPNTGVLTH